MAAVEEGEVEEHEVAVGGERCAHRRHEGGGKPWIRFVTGANSTVRLNLLQEKHLVGTLTISGTSQRGNDRPLKLERKE